MTVSSPHRGRGLGELVATTLTITPTGALSPGFLSASAIAVGGTLGAVGGVMVSLGHMLFELPYVALLVYSAERLERFMRRFERPMVLLTVAMAAYLAYGLLAAAYEALVRGVVEMPRIAAGGGLLTAVGLGLWFTGFNPYFLAWWVTIGMPIVRSVVPHGWKGFAVMYASHVWIDFAWLTLLAVAGEKLAGMAGVYGWLMAGLAAMLLLLAADMALRSFAGRRLLPF